MARDVNREDLDSLENKLVLELLLIISKTLFVLNYETVIVKDTAT